MSLNRRVAVVTGSSRGVGRECALALGAAGFAVGVTYLTHEREAENVAETIRYGGGEVTVTRCDVRSGSQVQNMIDGVVHHYGRLDVLVNNAGIVSDGTTWKLTDHAWNDVLDVNLTGAFRCTRAAIPYMRKSGGGRIVSITSVLGDLGAFGGSNYAASKAGLVAFTKSVAREVALFGITVNCLGLGYMESGMFQRLPQSVRNQLMQGVPLGREGKLSEVTGALLFLVSENSSYVTGQVIRVNGGVL